MNIRVRLLVFFLFTLGLLLALSIYAANFYRDSIAQEERVILEADLSVELAYQTQASYRKQLNAWKNILIRGGEATQYHTYLTAFYDAERESRTSLKLLDKQSKQSPSVIALVEALKDRYFDLGRSLRKAIRVFNDTDVNAGQVTDSYVSNLEEEPIKLLEVIVARLLDERDERILEMQRMRSEQEQALFIFLAMLIFTSTGLFIVLMDRSIGRPAEHAAYLKDVIDHAQQVAQFGTWDWDDKTGSHYWSEGVYKTLNVSLNQEASIEKFLEALNPEECSRCHNILEHAIYHRDKFEFEAKLLNREVDGSEDTAGQSSASGGAHDKWVLVKGEVKAIGKGRNRLTGLVYDISGRKQAEAKMMYLASYDELTGLPNRNLLKDRLTHAMAQAERQATKVALLFLDLDHFKAVNDALGHQAGDALLVQVAERIRNSLRAGDTAARLGGDEFVIVLEQIENSAQVDTVANHLLRAINSSYQIEGQETFITTCIGITTYPDDGSDVNTLLKNADSAMYTAKDRGRNSFYYFTQDLNDRAKERLHLENRLRNALERDEFQVYLQPLVGIESGQVKGAEALLRWKSEGELINPGVFIPILEDTGLIQEVGEWVLERACKAARAWQDLNLNIYVSVNLSIKQLRQTSISETVSRVLCESGVSSNRLHLELTESSLIDGELSQDNLKKLERLGVTLAIDDFGTGYSSLSYLKQYSVDVIKIDRSFVKDINIDPQDEAVTTAIIALSHSLGMDVTAEGVETLEQLAFLKKLNCETAQGFLFAKPMPEREFLQWLADQPRDLVHAISA